MTGERVNIDELIGGRSDGDADGSKRQQSTILFPYLDLNAGVDVAKAMMEVRGHSAVEAHELAAQMGQTLSGAFRLKTGTARIFGLTEREGRDGVKLSEIGRRIVEPETEKAARADAFMAVPLYAQIYEKYKGQRLPPTKALEREMIALGVSSKQADKARQAFDRSARQAGFFDMGDDRLVRPRFDGGTGAAAPADDPGAGGGGGAGSGGTGGGGSGGDNLHPFIQGLLQTLPEPGTDWNAAARADWLTAAATMFKLIYKGGGDVTVTAKPSTNPGLFGPQTE
jgi:hypothetical protein